MPQAKEPPDEISPAADEAMAQLVELFSDPAIASNPQTAPLDAGIAAALLNGPAAFPRLRRSGPGERCQAAAPLALD